MKARSREDGVTSEFSFTESIAGPFSSSLYPLDIDSWNKSVPLEVGDDANLDFLEMANQFLEPDALKEDTQSISSSMNDSAYMSQPDLSHLQQQQGTLQVNAMYGQQTAPSSREQSQPAVEGFMHSDMLSPALSSASQHGANLHTQYADMSSFMLPPAPVAGQQIPMSFGSASNSMFLDSADTMSSPFTTQAESQQFWAQDSQELFTPAVRAGSASLMQSQVNRRVSRPHNASLASQQRENAQQMQGSSARPRGRANMNFRSASTPMLPTGAMNIGLGHHTRPESERRASSNTIQGIHDMPLVASPAASVASHLAPYANASGQVDTFSYIDYDGGEDSLDSTSISTPLLPSSNLSESGVVETQQQGRTKTRAVRPVEDAAARSDPLYQRLPGHDDLYHCPFADEGEDCGHKPTKLKCNYDKYIDSHLKPFRCKQTTCIDVQFSSTACLLRHEREAHGMHGHGSKPNLCIYPDCERSQPGNGFPRRYNLYDHMRRVHDYSGPTNSPDDNAPVGFEAASGKKDRKRRISEDVAAPVSARPEKKSRSRAVSSASMLPPPSPSLSSQPTLSRSSTIATGVVGKRADSASLRALFEEKRAAVQLRLDTLGAMDLVALQRVQEDVMELKRIAGELNGLG